MYETTYIGRDVHKDSSVFRFLDAKLGMGMGPAIRVPHKNGELERYLMTLLAGAPVAVESCNCWMWMVGELEAAGIRDLRGLVRARLAPRQHQSPFKNRIHGTLNQYGQKNPVEEEAGVDVRDWFTVKAQAQLAKAVQQLPSATQEDIRQNVSVVRELELRIRSLESAMKARMGKLGWLRNLQSLPGVGKILGATIGVELGDVRRFPSAQHLARYADLVPKVPSSGGRAWRGPTGKDCNHYLKWAFVEAVNLIAAHQAKVEKNHPHVVELYRRVKATTKLSGKAKVGHGPAPGRGQLQAYSAPTSARVASSHNG